MLKSKLILTVAALAFTVSCTQSSNNGSGTTSSGDATPNIDVTASRLQMNGSQAPLELDFGSVKKSKSASRQITIKNDESAALEISAVVSSADSSASFKITSNGCPASLAAGKSCSIMLSGTGLIEGTQAGISSSGSIAIGAGHSADLLIKVTGLAQAAAASDSDLVFVTTSMATTSYAAGSNQYKQVTVTNSSTTGTHPGNIQVAADGWVKVSSTCLAPLAPTKSCTIMLSYSNWKTETAPSFSYTGTVGLENPVTVKSETTCTPGATRILKKWAGSESKSEIVVTADVGTATALTRESVAAYTVGQANVLEVCSSSGLAVSKAVSSCGTGFHKVEPKALAGATLNDFYCEPDTVNCN